MIKTWPHFHNEFQLKQLVNGLLISSDMKPYFLLSLLKIMNKEFREGKVRFLFSEGST